MDSGCEAAVDLCRQAGVEGPGNERRRAREEAAKSVPHGNMEEQADSHAGDVSEITDIAPAFAADFDK